MTQTAEIRTRTNPELLASAGQAFLTGETVYLRPPVLADAEYASAWKDSPFPLAPERVRAWITDDLAKNSNPWTTNTFLIVRRHDDRPVGSVSTNYKWFPQHFVTAHVDPLAGERGLAWKAEALALVLPWIVNEQQRPRASVYVPSRETPVIAALERIGARATARFREKLSTPGGRRDDELMFEFLNADWVTRLGDPAEVDCPRTGTGEPRPVTPPVVPEGDPPANAIRIGPRVYLRPPEEADARALAHWSTREIDASWDNGRYPFGFVTASHWYEEMQKETPPETIDFAVILRETGAFLGLVGLLDVDYRHRFGESASMILDPAYREAGYGSEAKHLLFDHLFNDVGIHALQSYVMFENTRSAAALRKQGYREAGRDHWVNGRDGRFVNFVCFDLLADEWRAMPRYDTNP